MAGVADLVEKVVYLDTNMFVYAVEGSPVMWMGLPAN
jgi:hypothetical protein